MSTVIDACALIAFLRDEPGAEAVQNLSNRIHSLMETS